MIRFEEKILDVDNLEHDCMLDVYPYYSSNS